MPNGALDMTFQINAAVSWKWDGVETIRVFSFHYAICLTWGEMSERRLTAWYNEIMEAKLLGAK